MCMKCMQTTWHKHTATLWYWGAWGSGWVAGTLSVAAWSQMPAPACWLRWSICLVYTLQLVVDTLGLGNTVKVTWDPAPLEIWSLLTTCWWFVTQHQVCPSAMQEAEDGDEKLLLFHNCSFGRAEEYSTWQWGRGNQHKLQWLTDPLPNCAVLKLFQDSTDVLCAYMASYGLDQG